MTALALPIRYPFVGKQCTPIVISTESGNAISAAAEKSPGRATRCIMGYKNTLTSLAILSTTFKCIQTMIVEFMRGLASVNLIVVSANDVIVAERLAVVMLVFTPFVVSFASNVKLP